MKGVDLSFSTVVVLLKTSDYRSSKRRGDCEGGHFKALVV